MPAEQFVGRDGGDEFIAVTHGLDEEAMRECLTHVREAMTEESKHVNSESGCLSILPSAPHPDGLLHHNPLDVLEKK